MPSINRTLSTLSIALAATMLGGCFGPPTPAATPSDPAPAAAPTDIRVSVPKVGDAYEYEGDDGSRLVVKVANGVRKDAFLVPHDSVLIQYTYYPGEEQSRDAGFPFEEAISRTTQLVVQQAALCGVYGREPGGRMFCAQPDRRQVLPGAGGLPGAFGISPYWGQNVPADTTRTLVAPGKEPIQLKATLSEARIEGRKCVHVEHRREGTMPPVLRILPWTVISTPLTVCDGLSLPYSFTTETAPIRQFTGTEDQLDHLTYTNVRFAPGTGQGLDYTPDAEETESPVPRRQWTSPFYVNDSDDPFPLSTIKAHEVAMADSAEYRRVFEADPPGMLVFSQYQWGGASSLPNNVMSEDRHTRILVARSTNGTGVALKVDLKTINTALGSTPTYSVRDVQMAAAEPLPTVVALQVGLKAVAERAKELTGFAIEHQIGGFSHKFLPHWWTIFEGQQGKGQRTTGYEAYVYLQNPDDGGLVVIPYLTQVDGPTGALLQVDLPKDRYPL